MLLFDDLKLAIFIKRISIEHHGHQISRNKRTISRKSRIEGQRNMGNRVSDPILLVWSFNHLWYSWTFNVSISSFFTLQNVCLTQKVFNTNIFKITKLNAWSESVQILIYDRRRSQLVRILSTIT
jgi:hypothetical protein